MKTKVRRSVAPVSGESGAYARKTVTLPQEMTARVNAIAGPGKFSAFTQRALLHEIQRESVARWLDERESARKGEPLSDDALAFAEEAWQKGK